MIDLKLLLSLDVFKDLDDVALVDVARHATVSTCQVNDRLVAEKLANYTLYLLEGVIDVQSTGGVSQSLQAGEARAQEPIFLSDTPGHYARSTTPCRVLQVERSIIDKYGIKHKRDKDELNLEEFDTMLAGDSSLSLINEITRLFKSKSVTLPSLPEIALHINAVIGKEDTSISKIAAIIQGDPVIAARLVQVANSAFYGGGQPIEGIKDAISRIGLEGVQTIVMAVVLRDLFMPKNQLVNERMIQFYEHSIRIGVLCYDLAKRLSGFKPEHAFLLGILHDIGVVPILVVADSHPELAHKAGNLDMILDQLKSYIGGIVLQQWGFAVEYSDVAQHAYDWNRQIDKPDYCDLLQVALLHSHLVGGQNVNGPTLTELPAFHRLGMDKLDPAANIKLVKALAQRIDSMITIICK